MADGIPIGLTTCESIGVWVLFRWSTLEKSNGKFILISTNGYTMGSILGLGRYPREGSGNPLQYSCLRNPVDRGTWWTTVYGVAKESDMTWRLNNSKGETYQNVMFHFPCLCSSCFSIQTVFLHSCLISESFQIHFIICDVLLTLSPWPLLLFTS